MTVLHLPLPPKEASPNWRGHWAPKAKATNRYRWNCKIVALAKGMKHRGPTTVRYSFHFKDWRRRDPDNLVASMKAALDGIRDSGMIPDDSARDVVLLAPQVVSGAESDQVVVEIAPNPPATKRLAPHPYEDAPELTR